MANHQARMSMYSVASDAAGGPRGAGQQSSQVSTTTLLNAIHNIYLSSQPYRLEAGTSAVVNTWLTAAQTGPDGRSGGTVDASLAARAWEHARRRAEDGCIILGSLHTSTPSLLTPFLETLPMNIPSSVFTALEVVKPFIRCVTPYNPSTPRQAALGVTLTLNLTGTLTGATLALSQGGIDTKQGLFAIPSEPGYRAFDVFYYLLTSASTPAEREFLGLKSASSYSLLAKSGTYDPPSYLATADDAAAADDFRTALKDIGIKGSAHRNFISTLAGLLKLGNTLDYNVDGEEFDEIIEDVAGLLGLDPEVLATQCTTEDRQTFIGGLYEALVDWVIVKANESIANEVTRNRESDSDMGSNDDAADTVCITVVEVPDPNLGKGVALRGVFDDSQGINAEMKEDGVEVVAAGHSVLREMQNAVAEVGPDLGIMTGPAGRDRQHELEKREVVMEKLAYASEDDGFLKKLLFPVAGEGINLGRNARFDLPALVGSSRVWYHLSLHPTDDSPSSLAALPSVTSAWSAGTVSRQLRAWRLPEWANRRNKNLDFTADYDLDEFTQRFAALGCRDGREGIETWVLERGWSNGEVVVGRDRVWMRETAWWEAESMLDLNPTQDRAPTNIFMTPHAETAYSNNGSGFFPSMPGPPSNDSRDHLMHPNMPRAPSQMSFGNNLAAPSIAPTNARSISKGDYGLGHKGDTDRSHMMYAGYDEFMGTIDPSMAQGKHVETQDQSSRRRIWVGIVWAFTCWIPSPLLSFVGRMKRPDVRMAWREKLTICFLIFLLNAAIIFWIIGTGFIICPKFDKVWTIKELKFKTPNNDAYWVAIHGNVYDMKDWWKQDHGTTAQPAREDLMRQLAGLDMSRYFQPPLGMTCPNLGIDDSRVYLWHNMTDPLKVSTAEHISGSRALDPTSELADPNWYSTKFQPKIKEFYHGELVQKQSEFKAEGHDSTVYQVTYDNKNYDMSEYFITTSHFKGNPDYNFLDSKIVSAVKDNPGDDVTKIWDNALENAESGGNQTEIDLIRNSITCIKNTFYVGYADFRYTPRCQANNWILLAFAMILCAVILVKFLAALQFGSKRRPSPQDKFVICQVPAYTEGEDSLRKALDSLTALQYDNKRKLICVICDGVIIGEGNDRPTPKIVLDILGVDPKVDPPALPFKSVGTGNLQLNYGKVYSGLYEFEGNVVPYIVVVKVGKESEQAKSKPGNRGKRDSQILLMSFLNRVHHRAPMNPLELEMFHQINNVIGVDPELYEYLFMVDADTSVREDALNRLVAACANNSKIAGICGETGLQNEERSWWSMIQVYEYYISHHLSKAFESLFGSVTCLPGCFTMYRLRTVDKGKPLIIADSIINDYSMCNVDTLHKKNLLSLGEDRFLTTLMTRDFPQMLYKFIPDAYCQTAAPDEWGVLLSQRRRWINSTVHNLCELVLLRDMCGFCCFSMRFVVFIDLFGTLILPSACAYLGWLFYSVATPNKAFPIISIAMLAAVYGLQALVFILKRQWQHVGWMIIYLIAFPVYSFILPIYSFWNQDNFTWGSTRVVVGENGKQRVVVSDEDEGFDLRSIPLQTWDNYAANNNLPGRRGHHVEKGQEYYEDTYEMDDMKSVYSSVRQGSVLTGLQGRGGYMPPQSPAPFQQRQSSYGPYGDGGMARQSTASFGDMQRMQTASPYQDQQMGHGYRQHSVSNLRSVTNASPAQFDMQRQSAGTPLGLPQYHRGGQQSSSVSSFDFQRGNVVDESVILDAIRSILTEVDLDTVTKKQVRALVEQRLQTELSGDKRAFMDRQIDNELANM